MLDSRQLEEPLSPKEQTLRDHFVSEYLKDFDAYNACLRLGFLATYATQWSQLLLQDGYVQRKLAFLRESPESPEQEQMDKVMARRELRRVAQKGSDSARVAAVRQLAAMYGWTDGADAPNGAEDLIAAFREMSSELPT